MDRRTPNLGVFGKWGRCAPWREAQRSSVLASCGLALAPLFTPDESGARRRRQHAPWPRERDRPRGGSRSLRARPLQPPQHRASNKFYVVRSSGVRRVGALALDSPRVSAESVALTPECTECDACWLPATRIAGRHT
jgi:hypothetical protein